MQWLTVKSDGAWRLILALLRSEDLRLRGISTRSSGGLHARQQPPGCGHGRVRGEHAAQVSVHHSCDVFVFPDVEVERPPRGRSCSAAEADVFWLKVIDDFDWDVLNTEIWVTIST